MYKDHVSQLTALWAIFSDKFKDERSCVIVALIWSFILLCYWPLVVGCLLHDRVVGCIDVFD